MTAALAVARERSVRSREHLIASRLRRFAWRHCEAVSALARRHPRLADLALSFPALLFALAVPRRGFDPEPVIERAIMGAPLSQLAADAAIPMWTRKLMPEAFLYPVPHLPDGELFRLRVGNVLPPRPDVARRWLHYVSEISYWGNDALAAWCVYFVGGTGGRTLLPNWKLLCLWAWHCEHPETPAGRIIETCWRPEMSPAQAIDLARDWATDVAVRIQLAEEPLADMWASSGVVDGYAFEPVRTASDLIHQARSMNNCARNYAVDVAWGRSRIWVARKDGHHVSMLELRIARRCPVPQIVQIQGSSNSAVSAEHWEASVRWLARYGNHRVAQPPRRPPLVEARWAAMWRSYWLAKRRIPGWLPYRESLVRWPLPEDRLIY